MNWKLGDKGDQTIVDGQHKLHRLIALIKPKLANRDSRHSSSEPQNNKHETQRAQKVYRLRLSCLPTKPKLILIFGARSNEKKKESHAARKR